MGAEPNEAMGEVSHREAWIRHCIQRVLRGGLATSVVLMAAGLAIGFAAGEQTAPPVRLFALGSAGGGETIMALGVLALAITPLLRVLVLIGLWAHERDWRFVATAVVVLAVLVTSTVVGRG